MRTLLDNNGPVDQQDMGQFQQLQNELASHKEEISYLENKLREKETENLTLKAEKEMLLLQAS